MHLRILSAGLLGVAVSILWMAAATASATTLTTPESESYTGSIVAEAEGHVVIHNPISRIECGSNVEGNVETHGEGVTAGGKTSLLTFTGCTNGWHVTTVSAGSLEVHESGSGNGTVTLSGATIEATRFGITCRYATSSTDIGTLTGGSPATLDINTAVPFHGGSALCGESAVSWTGSYTVTTPSTLTVALATLSKKVFQKSAEVKPPECKFTNVGDKCQIKFEVNGAGEGYKVLKNEWTGKDAAIRYKSTVGCGVNKVLKAGSNNCTDEIEMIKKEAGTNNEWVVWFELENGGGLATRWSTKLSM